MPENPRQEIELSLGDKTYRVRPTFEVLASVEAALDQPARVVGRKCLSAGMSTQERAHINAGPEISLSELSTALFWILRGQEGAPESVTAVGHILMEDGFAGQLLPVGQFLVRAQRGNKIHEKEAAQAAAKEAAEEGAKDPQKS